MGHSLMQPEATGGTGHDFTFCDERAYLNRVPSPIIPVMIGQVLPFALMSPGNRQSRLDR